MQSKKMISLILLVLSIAISELQSEKALVIESTMLLNGRFRDFENYSHEYSPCFLTACPASTEQEKQFDEKVSLGGSSIFSREFYPQEVDGKDIELDYCEKPCEPVMIYNHEYDVYEIGYELYYEDGKGVSYHSANETLYRHHRPVKSTKNQNDYKILGQPSPPVDFVTRYEDGQEMKFNITNNGSRTLVFNWMPVLNVKCSGYNKRVSDDLAYWFRRIDATKPQKCHSVDENIFSEKNQEIYLKDILIPPFLSNATFTNETQTFLQNHTGELRSNYTYSRFYDFFQYQETYIKGVLSNETSCGQAYGCLVNAQIAPIQFFKTRAERRASCSFLNMIPVWKTIAGVQLRKVDVFLMVIERVLDHPHIIFGVSDVLKMKKTTHPEEPQQMYLSDPENQKVIPIPKIIYRVIEHRCDHPTELGDPGKFTTNRFAFAIIIHNDPSPTVKDERLCESSHSLGWELINNNDPRTGLTYVCPLTVELNEKLKAYDNVASETFQFLNLSAVPYSKLRKCDTDDRFSYNNHVGFVYDRFKYTWMWEFV